MIELHEGSSASLVLLPSYPSLNLSSDELQFLFPSCSCRYDSSGISVQRSASDVITDYLLIALYSYCNYCHRSTLNRSRLVRLVPTSAHCWHQLPGLTFANVTFYLSLFIYRSKFVKGRLTFLAQKRFLVSRKQWQFLVRCLATLKRFYISYYNLKIIIPYNFWFSIY